MIGRANSRMGGRTRSRTPLARCSYTSRQRNSPNVAVETHIQQGRILFSLHRQQCQPLLFSRLSQSCYQFLLLLQFILFPQQCRPEHLLLLALAQILLGEVVGVPQLV